MSRIHPAAASRWRNKTFLERVDIEEHGDTSTLSPNKLTVWKRSSMTFQGTDGFTVFDQNGKLAFRVDNYSRTTWTSGSEGGGLVLMDGAGNALLTLTPQMWSIQRQWNAYRDQNPSATTKQRLFSLRRSCRRFLRSSSEAEVFLGSSRGREKPDFTIEGSFQRRNCCIRSSSGVIVARMARKRVKNIKGGVFLGDDVFSLVVEPGFDAEMVMGFVVVLDRICPRSFGPVLCS